MRGFNSVLLQAQANTFKPRFFSIGEAFFSDKERIAWVYWNSIGRRCENSKLLATMAQDRIDGPMVWRSNRLRL